MGWMPKASLESSAGDAVFALDIGKWTQPVSSPSTGSYFVYKVTEKATAMAITSDQQKTIEDQTFQNQQDQVTKATEIARPYITDQNMWTDLAKYAQSKGAGAAANQ